MRFRDFGKKYDSQKYFKNLIFDNIDVTLKPLILSIKSQFGVTDIIKIADWGGGNGILAKYLLKSLSNYKNIKITIIDLDKDKVINHPKIDYVINDVSNYRTKEGFDFSIARNVLHYLNEKNNKKFLSNVCDSTKHSFLLENFTINEKDKNKWQRLSKLLKKEFEIDRHYYTVKQIREMLIEDNLWKIKKEYSWIKKDLDFLKFVKSRFKVKQEAIDKYFKSKKNLIKRHPTKIFWCSKAH